jgi:hypothetical protein
MNGNDPKYLKVKKKKKTFTLNLQLKQALEGSDSQPVV